MSSKKSTERLRAQLLGVAAQLLGELHLRSDFFSVTISTTGGLEVRMRQRPGADLGEDTQPISDEQDTEWLTFSPLEARLIHGLSQQEWQTTAELAARISEELSPDLRAVLRNLQERHVCTLCTRRGVHLNSRSGQCAQKK